VEKASTYVFAECLIRNAEVKGFDPPLLHQTHLSVFLVQLVAASVQRRSGFMVPPAHSPTKQGFIMVRKEEFAYMARDDSGH